MNKIDRFDGLDALRGIAATLVIIYHSILLTNLKDGLSSTWYANLGIAVPIFFCISGFSLFHGYHTTVLKDEKSFKKFYIRRFFRIAPLFYIMLLFYIMYYLVKHLPWDIETILANITFTFTLIPGKQESMVWSGWSIGIEWVFYFIFPLLVLISKNRLIFYLTLFISLYFSLESNSLYSLINYDQSSSFLYMNIFKHGIYFMIGIFICKVIDTSYVNTELFKKISQLDFVVLTALYILINNINNESCTTITGFAIVTLAVIFSVMGGSVVLNNRFTRFLGTCSYGMYLFNPLIIYILTGLGVYRNVVGYFPSYPFLCVSLGIAVTIIITIFAAWVSHNYFEQHFINIGRKMISDK